VSNLAAVLSFLQGKGLTPAQAAGVAGNLQVESGVNIDPAASNAREGAVGIAQWEGGRRAALDAFAARTGGSETDLGTQLNYLWSEFQGPESSAYRKLLATNDPASAAAVVDQFYERSSGAARAQRVADAQAIYNGQPAGGSSTGGSVENAGNPLSITDPSTWLPVLLKVAGGAVAGVLVVVGLNEALKGHPAS
jgi:hypothetical protein